MAECWGILKAVSKETRLAGTKGLRKAERSETEKAAQSECRWVGSSARLTAGLRETQTAVRRGDLPVESWVEMKGRCWVVKRARSMVASTGQR
jgi:hypothetical protein